MDALIERFTVGEDYILDRRLIAADAVGSIAHAQMLAKVGIIATDQAEALTGELRKITMKALQTGISIDRAQEDSHTAIEELLVVALGEAGKRIHTGRSRNDQVMASTRLFAREGILAVRESILETSRVLGRLARREERTPMPGRTHLQPAMPSTVGLWAAGYAESFLDAYDLLIPVYRQFNRSALGTAAGYGVPLPLDREYLAELLGCDGIHHNVLSAMASRGSGELALLDACTHVGIVAGRFAQDVVLFSMPEFGYFTLPDELCTGSSIMPQKRNPDAMELMRGKSAVLSSLADRVRGIIRSLPAGYNRDLQETKAPMIQGLDLILDMLAVIRLTVEAMQVNEGVLREAFTTDIFATDEAIRRVVAGESFRDAYRAVAADLKNLDPSNFDLDEVISRRTATGTPGNLDIPWLDRETEKRATVVGADRAAVRAAVGALVGQEAELYPGFPSEG
ncbi:MAG: argininosuccinate lyase [Spirochaetales bacterium]|nr:MAG: argininosuccinate lyase [Spirochaetales bacterium]